MPVGAAQAVELERARLGVADVLADKVKLRNRDVEHVLLCIFYFNVVLGDSLDGHRLYAVEKADSVRRVDDVVALVQLVERADRVLVFAVF